MNSMNGVIALGKKTPFGNSKGCRHYSTSAHLYARSSLCEKNGAIGCNRLVAIIQFGVIQIRQ